MKAILGLGVLVALIAGNAVAGCEVSGQKGCLELRVLNLKYEEARHVGLTKPVEGEERVKRILGLGGELWAGYKAGSEQASKPRAFYFVIWNPAKDLQNGEVAAYRVNGRQGAVSKIVAEDITEQMKGKLPVSDPTVSSLGAPVKVYRVTTSGDEAVAASIQLPVGLIGAKTHVLICAEDKLAKYPNRVTASYGLHASPEQLAHVMGKNGVGIMYPYLSIDQP